MHSLDGYNFIRMIKQAGNFALALRRVKDRFILQMKLFILENDSCEFDKMTADMTGLIIKILERLMPRNKLELVHMALFLFHCQAKVVSFHCFDRYTYACAAILVAAKLTENIDFYPKQIIKALRTILRQRKGMEQVDDDEQKQKALMKKLLEAEVTIMINIGFDFDIELGVYWASEWSRGIKDSHCVRKLEDALTSLYQTSTVVFFEPRVIALTALSIVVKIQGINLEICDWDSALTKTLKGSEDQIKPCREHFLKKKPYISG